VPDREPEAARKQWIAGHLQAKGALVMDAGAVKALTQRRKSLLPAGIKRVSGEFSRGEMVLLVDEYDQIIGRGLVNYGIEDARKIIGHPSSAIRELLGFMGEPELVHRDNLALSDAAKGLAPLE